MSRNIGGALVARWSHKGFYENKVFPMIRIVALLAALALSGQTVLAQGRTNIAAQPEANGPLFKGLKFHATQRCEKDPTWGVDLELDSVQNPSIGSGYAHVKCWGGSFWLYPKTYLQLSTVGSQVTMKMHNFYTGQLLVETAGRWYRNEGGKLVLKFGLSTVKSTGTISNELTFFQQ